MNQPMPVAPPSQPPSNRTAGEAKPPGEVNQRVIIAALVVALLFGAGIVYWFVFGSSPRSRQVKIDPSQPTMPFPGGGGMTRIARPPPLPIQKLDDNGWIVRGNTGGMRVQRDAAAPGAFKFTYFFTGYRPPADALALWSAQARAIKDQAMAKEWGITPEQVKQLKAAKFGGPPGAKPTPADRQAIEGLWGSYVSATDGAARMDLQKKLIDKLDESAKAGVEAAKKAVSEHADRLRQILKPEQVAKMTKPG
jgi:hypothetical protein